MVLILPDPDGQDAAATGMPSPSDCYPVGPVGPYVAGGTVGPDVYNTDPDSLTHMVRIPPDPDGQDAATTGTPSPSDCYPDGPACPYVAGGPVGPDDCLSALESCEHLVPDHSDPVGQHDVDLDTAESLDGRPMDGIRCPKLLEYSLRLLDATLDGGLVERISEWKPLRNSAISYTLDSRPMEGIINLEHSALDSKPTEWAPCLEPLEQSVLSSSLAVRPVECITKKVSDWKPVINPLISYTWTVNLWRGLPTTSVRLWGCLWTVGLRRGRRV